jgi:plastocyanin
MHRNHPHQVSGKAVLALMVGLGLILAGCQAPATAPPAVDTPTEAPIIAATATSTPIPTEEPATPTPEPPPPSPTPAPPTPTNTQAPAQPTPTQPLADPTATPEIGGPASVTAIDSSFSPRQVTVVAGTTVTWTNSGNLPHTVTAENGSFDSGILSNGDTFAFTFNTVGRFDYYCILHGAHGGEGMAGVIIVIDDDY